jgi:hypothetical protein
MIKSKILFFLLTFLNLTFQMDPPSKTPAVSSLESSKKSEEMTQVDNQTSEISNNSEKSSMDDVSQKSEMTNSSEVSEDLDDAEANEDAQVSNRYYGNGLTGAVKKSIHLKDAYHSDDYDGYNHKNYGYDQYSKGYIGSGHNGYGQGIGYGYGYPYQKNKYYGNLNGQYYGGKYHGYPYSGDYNVYPYHRNYDYGNDKKFEVKTKLFHHENPILSSSKTQTYVKEYENKYY